MQDHIVILVDTREKVWGHIEDYFKNNEINYRKQTLQSGDYSFILEYDKELHIFAKQIVIERKNSLDELTQCFGRERARFEREFQRLKNSNTQVFLLIEEGSFDGLYKHQYRSSLANTSAENTLLSWMTKYNIMPIFAKKENSGRIIHNIFKLYLKNYLEGKID